MLCGLLVSGCGDCSGETVTGDLSPDADDGQCVGAECSDTNQPSDVADTTTTPDSTSSDPDTADAATCAPENQCASQCCGDDQLCLRDACVTPGNDCTHNLDCGGAEICEPTLAKCIPDPGITCEWRPPTQVFDPEVTQAWRDDANTPEPSYNQVMMTPAVMDIDESGSPDIVFATYTARNYTGASILRAIDGETHEPIFDLTDPAKHVTGGSSLALGDIDNDGRIEIVAIQPGGSGLITFDDHTTGWAIMWQTAAFQMHADGAALVDLDADGSVEVVAANRVYDGVTGDLKCIASGIHHQHSNSTTADLDGDGDQEVIAHNGAFRFESDGQGGYTCPTMYTYEAGAGFPAVGDFGTFTNGQRLFGQLDGIAEIVTVSTAASDQVQLINGQTGERIWSASIPTTGHPHFSDLQCSQKTGAGPPTVADFDGDGVPELATAGACYYVVYETDGSLLWKHASQDFSSRITGSSVFDFQGDGTAEAVYADECFMRVYDGAGNGDETTDVLFKRAHTSWTTRELPVIVDVDADYHADIVFISNDSNTNIGGMCRANWTDFEALGGEERGILIASDKQNRWVSTRQVWNQHAYHVTNICDGVDDSMCAGRPNTLGAIPIGMHDNWTRDHLNNFRQNVQGDGLFNAPDLQITNVKTTCDGSGLELRLTVANRGTRGVRAGVEVGVWVTVDGTETYLTTLTTTKDLPPGGRETLAYQWTDAPEPAGQTISVRAIADGNELDQGQHNECKEDNNETINDVSCTCQDDADCDPAEFCTNSGQCLPIDG
jgi:hypothetical protein